MSRFIDTQGRPIADASLEGRFDAVLRRARIQSFEAANAGNSRADAAKAAADSLGNLRAYNDALDTFMAQAFDHAIKSTSNTRNDAASSPSGGLFLADQLRHIYAGVMEEKLPVPNGLTLFPVDRSVPLGARTHVVRRMYDQAESRWYRSGQNIPRSGISQAEQAFNVGYIVSEVGYNLFDELAAGFANVPLVSQLIRSARRSIERFASDAVWNGSSANNIYGILSYPWLAKKAITTAFTSATTDTRDILQALHDLVNYPSQTSKQVFSPNRMVMSKRTHDFLSQTIMANSGGMRDRTILEVFLANNAAISKIDIAHELENAGGTGVDGIFVYSDDPDALSVVLPGSILALPPQTDRFETAMPMYMPHGGVIMRDVGANILGLVTAA